MSTTEKIVVFGRKVNKEKYKDFLPDKDRSLVVPVIKQENPITVKAMQLLARI